MCCDGAFYPVLGRWNYPQSCCTRPYAATHGYHHDCAEMRSVDSRTCLPSRAQERLSLLILRIPHILADRKCKALGGLTTPTIVWPVCRASRPAVSTRAAGGCPALLCQNITMVTTYNVSKHPINRTLGCIDVLPLP